MEIVHFTTSVKSLFPYKATWFTGSGIRTLTSLVRGGGNITELTILTNPQYADLKIRWQFIMYNLKISDRISGIIFLHRMLTSDRMLVV